MSPRTRLHGELEMAIMNVLWSTDETLTVRDIRDRFEIPTPAITTLTTVVERLRAKDWVTVTEMPRAKAYGATRSREAHTAELMTAALAAADDRSAALLHFAGTLSSPERAALRRAVQLAPPSDDK